MSMGFGPKVNSSKKLHKKTTNIFRKKRFTTSKRNWKKKVTTQILWWKEELASVSSKTKPYQTQEVKITLTLTSKKET